MTNDQPSNLSRRSILRTAGATIATGIAASTPVVAASTDQQNSSNQQRDAQKSDPDDVGVQLHEGQQVVTTVGHNTISVWTGIYKSDKYLGEADGGPSSRPHGITLGDPLYSPYYDRYMINVNWTISDPQGWSFTDYIVPDRL